MNEMEEDKALGQTLRRAMPDDLPTDVELRMREQFDAYCARADAASRSRQAARRNRITHWIGSLTMRQRITALVGIAAALALGFVLASAGLLSERVSAMEKMAQEIRKAKSYKCVQIVRITDERPEPGEPAVSEGRHTVYWRAPGSARTESVHSISSWKGPGPEDVEIYLADKRGLTVNHRRREFVWLEPLTHGVYGSTFDNLEALGRFSGKADRDLGVKEINGKPAHGFQLAMRKMDAEFTRPGVAEIWLDPQSNLPVVVRFDGMKGLGYSSTNTITDIQWNIDLAAKLFDTTPPPGYRDATRKPLTVEQQVDQVTAALQAYVEASGGRYPADKHLGMDTVEDLYRMLGFARWPTGDSPAAQKARQGSLAFDGLVHIQATNPDFAYHGKIVGPKDARRVLVRWKLDDGRFAVVFGDLRAETVTAERLRELEAK
jgi:outer membrane lipoprotein-sorting protein